MTKTLTLALAAALLCAATAEAQPSDRRGGPDGRSRKAPAGAPAYISADKPVDDVEIVGVVRAVDAAAGRVIISYELVEVLDWPKGTMPFVVAKSALLKDVTVGEKVRFKLQSQQISALRPF